MLQWFSRNRARVDMTSAAAAGAGLCMTGLVLLKVSMLDRVDPLDFSGIARVVFLTTMPYLVAGLVIHLLWTESLRRTIPSWINDRVTRGVARCRLSGCLEVLYKRRFFECHSYDIGKNSRLHPGQSERRFRCLRCLKSLYASDHCVSVLRWKHCYSG